MRVGRLEGDDTREMSRKMRIGDVEPLFDELGVRLVLGEDDGLAEAVAARDLQPFRHHICQHLVDGVGVEQPVVDGLWIDAVGWAAVLLVPLQHVPLFLFRVGEFVVSNALALELERHGNGMRRHQPLIRDRLVEGVGVGRDAILKVEEVIGVAIDLVLRRRGEADEQAVEIVEDCAIALVDRPVRLVDDDQVEVPRAKARAAALALVDQVHHRRIGRQEHAAFARLFRHQVDRRHVRQLRLEGACGLVDQRHPVGKKKHTLDPAGAHQQIDQRNRDTRLARPRGHDEQGLATLVLLEGLCHAPNGAMLVVAFDDLLVDRQPPDCLPARAALDQQLQFVLLVEARDLAWRIGGVVPDPVVVAIGVEDDGSLAEVLFQAIGIELRLLLAGPRIPLGPLGLDQRQWLVAVAPEHVVDEALALGVRHAVDGEFAVARLVELPAGFFEQ